MRTGNIADFVGSRRVSPRRGKPCPGASGVMGRASDARPPRFQQQPASRRREAPVEEGSNTFCFIDDAAGKSSLEWPCRNGAAWYEEWSDNHQGKHADVIFRSGGNYYIGEAKHVKEGDGGQDKKIAEVISFVSNQGHNHGRMDVFYMSFLDGVYFNKFKSPKLKTKIYSQKTQIEEVLAASGQNYFIDTHGLYRLLRSI